MDQGVVLIVDDYNSFSEAIGLLLSKAGFEVLHAASGRKAKELVIENPEISLLLVDTTLPDIRSDELATWFRSHAPSLQILFMCTDFAHARQFGRGNSIMKPICVEALIQRINTLTESPKVL